MNVKILLGMILNRIIVNILNIKKNITIFLLKKTIFVITKYNDKYLLANVIIHFLLYIAQKMKF